MTLDQFIATLTTLRDTAGGDTTLCITDGHADFEVESLRVDAGPAAKVAVVTIFANGETGHVG